MTVKEAIEQLILMPQDALMVQAIDEEGNAFPLSHEFCLGAYHADWGQFEDLEKAWDEAGWVEAVCLWPQ